ncbi:hypothetical protein JB92DRAFT_2836606 [Gautieria morchelliformis]|nr:hypothetical protein JB92DRAFT_2836606 [Gautieria morchelliformis]
MERSTRKMQRLIEQMISEGLDPKTVFHSIPNAATSPPVDNDPEDSDSGRSELTPPPSHYDPKHSHQPESMDNDSNSGDMSEDEEPSFIHPGDVARPNYKSPDNHDINLDLETLGVKKTKGKQKQAPLPVPSAVNVSKKSATNSIKKAKRKIIEDSVEDGSKRYKTVDSVPKKTIEVKVVPPAPSTSAATADGARKSQRKVNRPMFLRKPHQLSQYVPSAALTPTIDCSCPRSARAQT